MQTRIIQDPWNGGRFQAQYRKTAAEPWGDIGDGKDTYEEARKVKNEFRKRHGLNRDDVVGDAD